MTAIRARYEVKTILDFSKEKCSRNKIKKSLQQCPIIATENKSKRTVYYFNQINVGMYSIVLSLPLDSSNNWNRLKDYKDFAISVYVGDIPIDLQKNDLFSNQEWVRYNFFGNFRVKHLIDAIMHCKRLDSIKAFL